MMLGGIFSWLIIGLLIYFMFFRKGGMMGCCGGHNHHSSEHTNREGYHDKHSAGPHEDIIDLKKEDHRVRTKASSD